MATDSSQSFPEPTISSIREDLESKYRSYLPVRVGSTVAYGLIDRGNCLENALSLDPVSYTYLTLPTIYAV